MAGGTVKNKTNFELKSEKNQNFSDFFQFSAGQSKKTHYIKQHRPGEPENKNNKRRKWQGEMKMKAIRETAKAVLVRMVCDEFENSNRHEVEVWLPKSQIHNGFAGTTVSNWIAGKKEEEFFANIKHDYIAFYDADGKDIEIEDAETEADRKASDDFVRGMIRIQRSERYAARRRKAA